MYQLTPIFASRNAAQAISYRSRHEIGLYGGRHRPFITLYDSGERWVTKLLAERVVSTNRTPILSGAARLLAVLVLFSPRIWANVCESVPIWTGFDVAVDVVTGIVASPFRTSTVERITPTVAGGLTRHQAV